MIDLKSDVVIPTVLDQRRLDSLTANHRAFVDKLDQELHLLRGSGRKIILAWTGDGQGIRGLGIPHYEFFHSEGLSPTVYSYIVGDVTIEFACMIDHDLPGQILVGDFGVDMRERDTGEIRRIRTTEFIEHTRQSLSNLEGIVLSGENVETIQCYLTGERLDSGGFGVKRYVLRDKHKRTRQVCNAKVNIYRSGGTPIYLRFQSGNLQQFKFVSEEYV
ncbi:MAG: hypothetical protein VW268_10350 [Rhodospirillaceae bacterium]